jgi:hypothetical protein
LKQVAASDVVGGGQVQVSLVTLQTTGTITVYVQQSGQMRANWAKSPYCDEYPARDGPSCNRQGASSTAVQVGCNTLDHNSSCSRSVTGERIVIVSNNYTPAEYFACVARIGRLVACAQILRLWSDRARTNAGAASSSPCPDQAIIEA